MSDVGQVHIHDKHNSIYLYTHWDASTLLRNVRMGLMYGKGRWNDFSYLTSIIFDYMREIGDFKGISGFGISCNSDGAAWRVVDIDVYRQIVTVYNNNEKQTERWMGSFGKYITINWRK